MPKVCQKNTECSPSSISRDAKSSRSLNKISNWISPVNNPGEQASARMRVQDAGLPRTSDAYIRREWNLTSSTSADSGELSLEPLLNDFEKEFACESWSLKSLTSADLGLVSLEPMLNCLEERVATENGGETISSLKDSDEIDVDYDTAKRLERVDVRKTESMVNPAYLEVQTNPLSQRKEAESFEADHQSSTAVKLCSEEQSNTENQIGTVNRAPLERMWSSVTSHHFLSLRDITIDAMNVAMDFNSIDPSLLCSLVSHSCHHGSSLRFFAWTKRKPDPLTSLLRDESSRQLTLHSTSGLSIQKRDCFVNEETVFDLGDQMVSGEEFNENKLRTQAMPKSTAEPQTNDRAAFEAGDPDIPRARELITTDVGNKAYDSVDLLLDSELRAVMKITKDGEDASTLFPSVSFDSFMATCDSDDGLDDELVALEMLEVDLRQEMDTATELALLPMLTSPIHTYSTDSSIDHFCAILDVSSTLSGDKHNSTPITRKVHFNDEVEEFLFVNEILGDDPKPENNPEETFADEIFAVLDDILDEISFACIAAANAMDRTRSMPRNGTFRRSSVY